MFWKKRKEYKFPHDYNSFIKGLFPVCNLSSRIEFTEVCNLDGIQHCVKRQATMVELLSNAKGNLYFRGKCRELGKERIFELLMPEYQIDGQLQNIQQWFYSVTGKTKHSFDLECNRKKSKLAWEGSCPLTSFIDVYTNTSGGTLKEVCETKEFDFIKVYIDSVDAFYIEITNLIDCKESLTYPMDLKFTTDGKTFTFQDWCLHILKVDIWAYFPDDE